MYSARTCPFSSRACAPDGHARHAHQAAGHVAVNRQAGRCHFSRALLQAAAQVISGRDELSKAIADSDGSHLLSSYPTSFYPLLFLPSTPSFSGNISGLFSISSYCTLLSLFSFYCTVSTSLFFFFPIFGCGLRARVKLDSGNQPYWLDAPCSTQSKREYGARIWTLAKGASLAC